MKTSMHKGSRWLSVVLLLAGATLGCSEDTEPTPGQLKAMERIIRRQKEQPKLTGRKLRVAQKQRAQMAQELNRRGKKPDAGLNSRYLSPIAIAKSPDETALYVANQTGRSISCIDTATCKVIKTIPLEKELTGIGITPDGRTLYATARSHTGEVYEVDIRSGLITKTLKAGHTPMSPRVTPDGKKLFVCNRFNNTLSVFSVEAGEKIADLYLPPREPVSLAITPDGKKVIVANHINGEEMGDHNAAKITFIDAGDLHVLKSIPLVHNSAGVRHIAITPDGKWAYVAHTVADYRMPRTSLDRMPFGQSLLAAIDVGTMDLLGSVDLCELDLGMATPWGACVSEDNSQIVVTHAGAHEMSMISRLELHRRLAEAVGQGTWQGRKLPQKGLGGSPVTVLTVELDFNCMTGMRRRIKLKGSGPRSVVQAGRKLYIPESGVFTLLK
ncbi:MAG: YncE family protein [Planctomycetota bacterium]|jgi:YVTN family beta-propeller protein